MAKWLLLDGFNLTFRAFYAIRDLTRSDGFPTNALHGWWKTILKLQDTEKPDHIVAFFDLDGCTHRTELHPEYKANRSETPEELIKQIPLIKELTAAMGVPVIEQSGQEADDLIATAAKNLKAQGHEVFMVSADKDLAQCIEPNISQLLPPPPANPKVGWRHLDTQGVVEKFGINPSQIIDYLALIGDSSDNIPGIPGVGPKTAVKWLLAHESLEGIIAQADQIKPERFREKIQALSEQLRINVQLIRLQSDLETGPLESGQAKLSELLRLLEDLEMKTALKEASTRFGPTQGELAF